MTAPILEMRVAVTTDDYEKLVAFYRDALGLDPAALWTTETTHAILFELGKATLEVFDEPQTEMVDQLEVGRRVSGQIRFALRVPDVDAALNGRLRGARHWCMSRLLPPGATGTLAFFRRTVCRSRCSSRWGTKNSRLFA